MFWGPNLPRQQSRRGDEAVSEGGRNIKMRDTAAAAVLFLSFASLAGEAAAGVGRWEGMWFTASHATFWWYVCVNQRQIKREDPLLCCTNSRSWSDDLAGYCLSLCVSVMFQLLLWDFLQRPTCLDGSIISGSLMWENNKNIGDFLHMLAPMSRTNNEPTIRKSGWYDYK